MKKNEQIKNIRKEIFNCDMCPLRQENERLRNLIPDEINAEYGNPVPGIGSDQAVMMIFGEAPGADEVVKNKPFVGKAGSLLRECLEEIEADPEMLYIANVINCRPPRNKFPQGDDVHKCVDVCIKWARKQIAIVRPKIVVGLGGQPLKYIFKSDERISNVYGKIFDWNIKALNLDTKYCATFHPSFCLRPGRTFDTTDLSNGQKMMAMSVSEKRDLLTKHLYDSYKLAMETK